MLKQGFNSNSKPHGEGPARSNRERVTTYSTLSGAPPVLLYVAARG